MALLSRRALFALVPVLMIGLSGIGYAESPPEVPASVDDMAPVQLVMIERDGCIYCKQWDKEVAPGYPNSSEGRAAPLLRLNVKGPYPEGLELERIPFITPTFILVKDGHEVDRIEGYVGAHFFWPLTAEMLTKNGVELDEREGT